MKFILTADTHLRDSQYNLNARGIDFLESAKQIVDYAAEHNAVVLHGGDLLDSRDLKGEVYSHLCELDAYAVAKGVDFLVVTGNHDLCEPAWASSLASYRKSLGISGKGGLRSMDNQIIDCENVRVAGIPFMSKQSLIERFSSLPPVDVVVWHGMVAELAGFAGEGMVSLAELPAGKARLFHIGDIHVRRYVEHNGMLAGYPGSTELCSRSEEFEKSVGLIEILPDARPLRESDIRMLPLKTRRVHAFRVENESHVSEISRKLRDIDHKALVFVAHSADVPDVDKRLRLSVDENLVILRCNRTEAFVLPSLESGTAGGEVAEFSNTDELVAAVLQEEVLSPAAFVPELLDDRDLRELATRLVDDTDPAATLSTWIEKRIEELTTQSHVS